MLNDISHLIAPEQTEIAPGFNLRPITIQSYALLERTKNRLISDPENAGVNDIAAFVFIHSAPLPGVLKAVGAFVAGNQCAIDAALFDQPPLPLRLIPSISEKIRAMIEEALGAQPSIEGSTPGKSARPAHTQDSSISSAPATDGPHP